MDKRFVFVTPEGKWSNLHENMFYDLYNDERVMILNSRFKPIENKMLLFFRKCHFSKKINKIINLPFKSVWGYTLDEIKWTKNKQYYLFLLDAIQPITLTYLKKLQEKFNVKCILFLFNSQTPKDIKEINIYRPVLNEILTFDYNDSKKYGFKECTCFYSTLKLDVVNKISYDLYYVGFNKGRLNQIHDIFLSAKANDVCAKMRIVNVQDDDMLNEDSIIYNQQIKYEKTLGEMLECNCNLEILSSGQAGATLRYYEAICYNKKLLTNNKNVVNLPFYNPNYIHVFENIEDIDWEWVKEQVHVDYHYDGRFSPIHLIDKIIYLENMK